MSMEELVKLGFRIETLPSGKINLYNKTQFSINGLNAYFCAKGEFSKTFEQQSVEKLLNFIKKIEFF